MNQSGYVSLIVSSTGRSVPGKALSVKASSLLLVGAADIPGNAPHVGLSGSSVAVMVEDTRSGFSFAVFQAKLAAA